MDVRPRRTRDMVRAVLLGMLLARVTTNLMQQRRRQRRFVDLSG